MRLRTAVLGAMVLAAGGPAAAQTVETPQPPVRLLGGLHLVGAVPVGEFADHIDGGGGVGFDIAWPVQANGWFALRGDVGWVVYGSETRRIDFPGSGGLVRLDLTTTNSILYVSAGPQLMVPTGPVRPYVNATGGFSYFSTTSSLKGDNNSESFADDTNHDDITMAWTAGGGVLIPVSSGRTPISINLGAQYHANGNVEYVTEDGIREGTGDRYIIEPVRSDANFVSIRLGVTIGIRPGAR